MSRNRVTHTRVARSKRFGETEGFNLSGGPFEAIVKSTVDPLRRGRIQVYIPLLGGLAEDSSSWFTVSYCSPYAGSTTSSARGQDQRYEESPQSYGFWAPQVDIDSHVLVVFANGDSSKGYYIGSLFHSQAFSSVPSGHTGTPADRAVFNDDNEAAELAGAEFLPTGETNYSEDGVTMNDFTTAKRPVNRFVAAMLRFQGLLTDTIRGISFSSSQRETPSRVIGINTPGRPVIEPTTAPDPREPVTVRQPGHSLTMDDGTIDGEHNLVRLRTSTGHQILMHDTAGLIYIANAEGSAWIELSNTGQIDVYANDSINFHAQGDINFTSNSNINMHAKGMASMVGDTRAHIEGANVTAVAGDKAMITSTSLDLATSGDCKISAGGLLSGEAGADVALQGANVLLNSGGTAAAGTASGARRNSFAGAEYNETTGWKAKPGSEQFAASRVPQHEPWVRTSAAITVPPTSLGKVGDALAKSRAMVADLTGVTARSREVMAGTVRPPTRAGGPLTHVQQGASTGGPAPRAPVITSVALTNVKRISPAIVLKQPAPEGEIGPLSVNQVKHLFAQIGQRESSMNYSAFNQFGYAGKYQIGWMALYDLKYFKNKASQSQASMSNPANWAGKNGLSSLEAYMRNHAAQEKIIFEYTTLNLQYLQSDERRRSSFDITDPVDTAGMLMCAHLLGAGGAVNWRRGNGGADANGTTGSEYYNLGASSVRGIE